MKMALPYIEKHGSNKHWVSTKKYASSMLINRIGYQLNCRKCSDCCAWMQNKGSYCESCTKKHRVDLKGYRKNRLAILHAVKYTCEICRGVYQSKQLALDHDHVRRTYRGVLCRNCNGGIGLIRDSVPLGEKLITYMESLHEEHTIETSQYIPEIMIDISKLKPVLKQKLTGLVKPEILAKL